MFRFLLGGELLQNVSLVEFKFFCSVSKCKEVCVVGKVKSDGPVSVSGGWFWWILSSKFKLNFSDIFGMLIISWGGVETRENAVEVNDFPWTRLSHSELWKAGRPGVLAMLALTCLGLANHTWRRSRVACNSGHNSGPKSLFHTIQGRSDSLTFFFLKTASRGSVEGDHDFRSSSDWDDLHEDASCSTHLPLLHLFEALEVLDSCWSRMLINDSIVDLITSCFSPELVSIVWISKQVSPLLADLDLIYWPRWCILRPTEIAAWGCLGEVILVQRLVDLRDRRWHPLIRLWKWLFWMEVHGTSIRGRERIEYYWSKIIILAVEWSLE